MVASSNEENDNRDEIKVSYLYQEFSYTSEEINLHPRVNLIANFGDNDVAIAISRTDVDGIEYAGVVLRPMSQEDGESFGTTPLKYDSPVVSDRKGPTIQLNFSTVESVDNLIDSLQKIKSLIKKKE
jgi:hypothetical protein